MDFKVSRKTASVFFFLLIIILPACADTDPKGPLVSNSAFPLYLPFINVFPESAVMLGQGETRFIVANHYANTCHYDPEILIPDFFALIDSENWILSLDANHGLFPFLDIGIQGSLMLAYGGVFDPIIGGFHSLFGFPNGSRGNVNDSQYNIFLRHGSDVWFDTREAAAGIGNITIRAKLPLLALSEERFFLSFQIAAKIPIVPSGTFLSSGKPDGAATILADFSFWQLAFYANAGYVLLGQLEGVAEADFNRHLFSFVACIEYIVSPEWSLYLQADGTTSAYNVDEFMVGDFSANFFFGFKLRLPDGATVQVAASEEFFSFSTTDVGLVLAYCVETR